MRVYVARKLKEKRKASDPPPLRIVAPKLWDKSGHKGSCGRAALPLGWASRAIHGEVGDVSVASRLAHALDVGTVPPGDVEPMASRRPSDRRAAARPRVTSSRWPRAVHSHVLDVARGRSSS